MKRSAIIPAAFVLFAFTGCTTIRQYDLLPVEEPAPPTTIYVIDIAQPEFPDVTGLAAVPCGTDGFPSGCTTPPTTAPAPSDGSTCLDGQPVETGCPRN